MLNPPSKHIYIYIFKFIMATKFTNKNGKELNMIQNTAEISCAMCLSNSISQKI